MKQLRFNGHRLNLLCFPICGCFSGNINSHLIPKQVRSNDPESQSISQYEDDFTKSDTRLICVSVKNGIS
ncbi:hypothetical protein DICVIV_11997 [Dictyocaulus viviparus]|uniref:Uncharacterized protein n=1 Tax=Dictyocaulus viviparus TaxID=29172 RepID=A0A0D8XED2_DICVI|nr:hypothetical protein DICVIV_11997 [Dictyocaulus viviparus]